MREERTPVLRKRTPAEELKELHPVERFLYRLFETLASVKLAIVLMFWLMVEGTLGSYLEANINPNGAHYFVYGSTRFHILLALLGLNILCAALIRFPWKRYQTGFLITHIGLLILLAGAFVTFLGHTDSLLVVEAGTTNDQALDPDKEAIVIKRVNEKGETETESVRVRFGPVTWGSKIVGVLPWRNDYVEEHQLNNGDLLRVKGFYAHSDVTDTYTEDPKGVPAIHYQLNSEGRGNQDGWLALDNRFGIAIDRLPAGASLWFWQTESEAEFDHYILGAPKLKHIGKRGTLAYSHEGKHYEFDVDALSRTELQIPDTNIKLKVDEVLDSEKDAKDLGPSINVQIKEGEKTQKNRVFAIPVMSQMLNDHSFDASKKKNQFSYYAADFGTAIQFVRSPTGRLGYRSYSASGLIKASAVEVGQENPAFGIFKIKVDQFIAKGVANLKIEPRKLPRGQQGGNRAVIVEYVSKGETVTANLRRELPVMRRIGDRSVQLAYSIQGEKLPFEVRLDKMEQPNNPGTNSPAMFTSFVTVFENKRGAVVERKEIVTMNEPLVYFDGKGRSYTLFQSNSSVSREGNRVSTFTVARDPGLHIKYAGAFVLCFGIAIMFYFGGYFKKRAKPVATTKNEVANSKTSSSKATQLAGAKS